MLIGIDDVDPKLKTCEIWSQNWNMLQFLWKLALEQMEHANYEYSTWNWWSWLKITNLVPKLKFSLIFIKFGTHNKSNMLIMNIILASV